MVGQVSIELEAIRGIWNLRASFDDEHDSLLVLSFLGETRILGMDEADELGELEAEGFDSDSQVKDFLITQILRFTFLLHCMSSLFIALHV